MGSTPPPIQGSTPPPIQEKGKRPYAPTEIVENIFTNLPVKTLIRFSSSSKAWNTLISDPRFVKQYRDSAALHRRHKVVVSALDGSDICCFCRISSVASSLEPIGTVMEMRSDDGLVLGEAAAPYHLGPCRREISLSAMCDEVWCVEQERMSLDSTLFLWNPCMRNYRKLPPPFFRNGYDFMYGLALDAVSWDCKILKVEKEGPEIRCELYSLKNNCWKILESPPSVDIWFEERKRLSNPTIPIFFQERLEYLNNYFHWMTHHSSITPVIICFNLSTEDYRVLRVPYIEYSDFFHDEYEVDVVVVSGKLSICRNDKYENRLRIWMMDEYGDEGSWTTKFDIAYGRSFSFMMGDDQDWTPHFRPLYLYDNGEIVVRAFHFDNGHLEIVSFKAGDAHPTRIASCVTDSRKCCFEAFLYLDSLVSVGCNE